LTERAGTARRAARRPKASRSCSCRRTASETDPMEQAMLYLKDDRFANRVFEGVADLTEAGRKAGDWLVGASGRSAKMTARSRAVISPCQI